jgi:hypothetical protein
MCAGTTNFISGVMLLILNYCGRVLCLLVSQGLLPSPPYSELLVVILACFPCQQFKTLILLLRVTL